MIASQTKEKIKWLFGVVCTVAAILSIAHLVEGPGTHRFPASPEKAKKVFDSKPEAHTMNKGGGPVDIVISAPVKGSVTQLEAKITASMDADSLKFAWNLPDGVNVSAGAVEGEIGAIKAGETITIHLSYSSSTEENRQIHLNVFKMVDGEAHGQVAQYNTANQEMIEAELKTKAEMFERSTASEGQLKIHQ